MAPRWFAMIFLVGAVSAQAADRRPNVVLIYADDLGYGDVGFNGRSEWKTPHLDGLAARGTRFDRFYTAAPICAPSRAAMLTGKYTIHCGVGKNDADLPGSEVTIAEALKSKGYATALFGKWHHGRPRVSGEAYVHPMDQGFDEFFGFTDATHAWEKFPTTLWDGREKKPSEGYADDLFTDRGVDFIRRNKDRPFFLYLPLISTHFHIEAPADELARHRGKLPEEDLSKPINANYAGLVTRLDTHVGRVVSALKEAGIENETLLVFTSDHGATFETGNRGASVALDSNRPFRGQKRTLWEGGIRVPAVVVWPGKIPAGSVSHVVTHMTDLLPTFLAAAGETPDPAWKVDGKNLLPIWLGSTTAVSPDRTLFWEWRAEGTNQTAAMRGDLKLVVSPGARPELFDVAADPAERRNLAAIKPQVAKRLKEELDAWLATEATP